MRKTLVAAALALVLTGHAAADERGDREDDAAEMAREGIEMLMRALSAFVDTIPQYEMPEVNENGDIIIRRIRPRPPEPEGDPPAASPEVDETET